MKAPVYRIKQVIETLQEIVNAAEDRGAAEVKTSCNTYGLYEFVSLGSNGFLDLKADPYDLVEDEDC